MPKCAEKLCGHAEDSHFSTAMGSFCKECPVDGNVWEHSFQSDSSSLDRYCNCPGDFTDGLPRCQQCGLLARCPAESSTPSSSPLNHTMLSCGHGYFDVHHDCVVCLQFTVDFLNKQVSDLRISSTLSPNSSSSPLETPLCAYPGCGEPESDFQHHENRKAGPMHYFVPAESSPHVHDTKNPFCATHPDLARSKPNARLCDPDEPTITLRKISAPSSEPVDWKQFHVGCCNGDHSKPLGGPMCVCHPHKLNEIITQQQIRIRELEAESSPKSYARFNNGPFADTRCARPRCGKLKSDRVHDPNMEMGSYCSFMGPEPDSVYIAERLAKIREYVSTDKELTECGQDVKFLLGLIERATQVDSRCTWYT